MSLSQKQQVSSKSNTPKMEMAKSISNQGSQTKQKVEQKKLKVSEQREQSLEESQEPKIKQQPKQQGFFQVESQQYVDTEMYDNFQSKFNQNLREHPRDDQFLCIEDLGGSLRIVEKSMQQWTRKHWAYIIDNFKLKEIGKSIISLQIKLRVHDEIRPKIWFWLTQLEDQIEPNPYEEYIRLKGQQSDFDEIIKGDAQRAFYQLPYFKPGKMKKKKKKPQGSQADIEKESQKSVESDDEDILDGLGEGQRKLFFVLRAYANSDHEIGYTQGMNCVAGCILFYLQEKLYKNKTKSFGTNQYEGIDQEVRAFQLLVHVCKKMNWREVYSKKMKKIKKLVSHLEESIFNVIPEVGEKIEEIGMPFLYFFDSYFFSLMMYRSPIEFGVRIIDIFLLEGEGIIFEILLRMLFFNRKQITSFVDQEELMTFLKQDLVNSTLTMFPIKQIIPLNHMEVINEC